MRKHCTRKARYAAPPMLVVLATKPELEIAERLSIDAFRTGRATSDDFDNLADCRDILLLAAGDDDGAHAITLMGYEALSAIKERRVKTDRFGATGDELQALIALVDYAHDFWPRQAGTTYKAAYNKLREHRMQQARTRTEAA